MGTRKKRPTSWVFFFLPAFGRYCAFGAARLRRAAPSARCAFGAPPSQLDRPCSPPDVPLTTGSTLRLSTYSFAQLIWMIDPLPLPVGERWVNPLPDEASRAKWGPEKKDPLRGSFFSYRPSAGAAPRSVPTQQTVYLVAPTFQLLTISLAKPFLSNTT